MAEAELATDRFGHRIQAFRLGITQKKAIGGGSLPIDNPVGTTMVMLHADADCYVAQGTTPVATAADFPLDAGAYIFVRTIPGKDKFAFIQRTGADSGTGFVTEGA